MPSIWVNYHYRISRTINVWTDGIVLLTEWIHA